MVVETDGGLLLCYEDTILCPKVLPADDPPPPLDYDIHDLRYIPVYIFFACQDFLMSLPPSPLTYFHKRCDVPVFVTTTPLGVFQEPGWKIHILPYISPMNLKVVRFGVIEV